jgi:hypothetical protein
MIHDQWCVQEMGLTRSSVNANARSLAKSSPTKKVATLSASHTVVVDDPRVDEKRPTSPNHDWFAVPIAPPL